MFYFICKRPLVNDVNKLAEDETQNESHSVQYAPRSLRGEAAVFFHNRNTGDKLLVMDVCLFRRSHKLI